MDTSSKMQNKYKLPVSAEKEILCLSMHLHICEADKFTSSLSLITILKYGYGLISSSLLTSIYIFLD